ncbi:DUF4870 domain-containing protein [Cerasicoccus arenae]|uniref:Orotate phosphoribosyltransferase n=1 Tax=Cerasicoccus arenae TaxID=424488 RepID=A0A8J3DKV6_9BACT|nr:DUF4870 domain-containing protein [Cerasicoccus arenae]MBK1859293.1 DUF4870 domain-containing protein [Cerasicoccus arenae]GHC13367.1 orotate phosphoribosyltransferase [Cerasicoccus arenae]
MSEISPSEKDARLWNMLCHLSALAMFTSIPLANILGPLIVWLIKKNEIPSVDQHGKEALNFQISMAIYMAIAAILIFVGIGVILLPVLAIADLILVIIASVKANNGEPYQYPITIRFIK